MPSAITRSQHSFCSLACSVVAKMRRLQVQCTCCGKHFEKTPYAKKGEIDYCSRACAQKIRKGFTTWVSLSAGRQGTLYFLKLYNEFEVFYKAGVTYGPVEQRYSNKKRLHGYQYEILATHTSDAERVYEWEQSIIESFQHLKYEPRKKIDGYTECFSSAEEILQIFPL